MEKKYLKPEMKIVEIGVCANILINGSDEPDEWGGINNPIDGEPGDHIEE